jgi:ribonuclease-3
VLGLPALLRVADKAPVRERESVRADAYEAVLAALYLDAGFAAALRLVERDFRRALEAELLAAPEPKQALQEWLQARGEPVPEYLLVETEGPGHEPHFRFRCLVGGVPRGEGTGRSKRSAQQQAARQALLALRRPGP